ncbi:hypothetical protein CAPTEDRAFT_225444 [Capitella teleta]|uniref:Uncharacterized protein n=1 Tax=Capitella teleta TaxID=283909 RepID=R7UES4_CAPTE|nr:hypothetical protein CAPTEDRAFT_225444 [Capitella teleta]|eukprot:ELU05034.1 hypothetical protein CAPTEDRAFT_225444 [Capitella teleta]
MELQMIGAIVAGITTAILLFIFVCVFCTHSCCPWRNVLMPWKKNIKLQWQLDRGDLDTKAEPPHHHPVIKEDQKPEPQVIIEPTPPPCPIHEDVIHEEPEEPEGPEPSRMPTPPPPQVEYEPSEKDDYPEPVHRQTSLIVSTITAAIEEKHALSDDFSYEHVQESRGGTLLRIEQQNQFDDDPPQPKSPLYSQPYDSFRAGKQLSYLNVREDNGTASVNSSNSPLLIQSSALDPEVSSMVSDRPKVTNMIRSFQNVSRNNSDVSAKDCSEQIYSKPDFLKKSLKSNVNSNNNSPISLAEFVKRKTEAETTEDDEIAGPSVPPKDYSNGLNINS